MQLAEVVDGVRRKVRIRLVRERMQSADGHDGLLSHSWLLFTGRIGLHGKMDRKAGRMLASGRL